MLKAHTHTHTHTHTQGYKRIAKAVWIRQEEECASPWYIMFFSQLVTVLLKCHVTMCYNIQWWILNFRASWQIFVCNISITLWRLTVYESLPTTMKVQLRGKSRDSCMPFHFSRCWDQHVLVLVMCSSSLWQSLYLCVCSLHVLSCPLQSESDSNTISLCVCCLYPCLQDKLQQ